MTASPFSHWCIRLVRLWRALWRRRPAASRPAVVPPVPRDIFLVAPGSIAALLAPNLGESERMVRSSHLPYGDFRDPAECDHFAALPPIERHALRAIDWDALARELTREA